MPYTKSMYTDYAKDDWDIISIFKATPYKSKAKNPKPKSRVRSLTTWIPCEYEEYKYFHYVDGHTVLLKAWMEAEHPLHELEHRALILPINEAELIAETETTTARVTTYKVKDKFNYRQLYRLIRPRTFIFS